MTTPYPTWDIRRLTPARADRGKAGSMSAKTAYDAQGRNPLSPPISGSGGKAGYLVSDSQAPNQASDCDPADLVAERDQHRVGT